MDKIKGILIDSGRVLNISSTGSWSYSPNFFNIVGKENFDNISKDKKNAAYEKAWNYVNSVKLVTTLEEEWDLFYEYFNILSNELIELKIDKEKKILLTDDMVLNYDKYNFFEDVFINIPKLSEKYKLCLVSDAWPSLREVYKKAGLHKYFDSMIISSEIGTCKPDKKIYTLAMEDLGLKEDEVIFIDDNIKNCHGAELLGIKSIVLDRVLANRIYIKYFTKCKYKIVRNLNDIYKLTCKK